MPDNLPDDPQNFGNSSPPLPAAPNPSNDNNIVDPVQSWIAKHEQRDEHGRFVKSDPPANTQPTQTLPNPPPITITENTKYSEKQDPPLVNANISVTNPVTYFKKWVGKFLKNQDIELRLRIKPFATIGLVLAFGLVGGTAFSIGRYFFPHSSPIFHRQVVYTGIVQKGEQGQYFLMSSDSTLWKLKAKRSNINLSTLENKQVVITGNLTSEKYLIEVSEVIVAETTQTILPSQTSPNPSKILSEVEVPNIPNQDLLPKLYSNITWETNQKKLLIFTSGKRRIELEGVYLESSKLNTFPQDFLNYYINQLTQLNFKQTLNSKTPDNITQSYEKDGLYLTFGVENIYSGSGESKKITSYKAYLEHN